MELRRVGRERGDRVDHGRKLLVIDLDQLGGVLGLLERLGHDECDGLADEARLVPREMGMDGGGGGRFAGIAFGTSVNCIILAAMALPPVEPPWHGSA